MSAEILFSCPLEWPQGWERTKFRRRSAFKPGLSTWEACTDVRAELRRSGADDVVVSSNLKARVDGMGFRGDQANPADSGVAVYFVLDGRRHVLACDRWDLVAHNLRAIACHVEALRLMDRWGVGSLERAFQGYLALPAAGATSASWRQVLGLPEKGSVRLEDVSSRFAELAKKLHPDAGGDSAKFRELLEARDRAIAEVGAA